MFWRPELLADLVILIPATLPTATEITFMPETWPGTVTSRAAEDGLHIVFVGDGDHHLWLPRPVPPGSPLAVELTLSPMLAARTVAALRFHAVLTGGTGPPGADRLSPQQCQRLIRALRAHDGKQDGASQREIAAALWGRARVRREYWPQSPLRTATARLLDTARRLIRGGYLKLLGRT